MPAADFAATQEVKTSATIATGTQGTSQERTTKAPKKTNQQNKGGASHTSKIAITSSSAAGESSPSAVTKKSRRKKKSGDRANAKSSSDGFGGGEDPIGKIKLKTVVRRLPPNVPEAVFWKAVSPWVIRPRSTLKQENSSSIYGDDEAGAEDGKEANVDYSYFVQGKLKDNTKRGVSSDSRASPHTFSRAYLHFTSIEHLVGFHRAFDGHLFKDAKGNEYVAIVEFAPCQRIPTELARKKKQDALQGTIEEDPDYKAFVTSLENKKAEDNGQTQSEKTDAQLMSQLLSTQSNIKNTAEKAKHTPLLDHLRAQHTAKAESSALKNARSYLNRNNNAYAAAASSTNTKGAEKGKAKAKGGQSLKEGSVPTGPKAGKNKEAKGPKKAPPPTPSSAKAESNIATSSTKQLPPSTGSKAKEKAKPPKGANSGKGPSGSKEDGTKLAILTKEGQIDTNEAIPTGPSADRGGGGGGGGGGGQRGRSRPPRGAGRGRGRGRGGSGGAGGGGGTDGPVHAAS